MFFAPVLVAIIVLLFASVRIIKEFERGVVYTFGKYSSSRGPGINLVFPGMQQVLT